MLVVLAALIAAPGFVDWTPYRDTFARQLSGAIGRPIVIEGSVSFALVPRPALEASGLRIETGSGPLAIAGARASLGLWSLLRGDLHFRDLQLDDPVGAVTVDLPWLAPAAGPGAPVRAAGPAPATLGVDRVTLSGGDLTLLVGDGGALIRAQNMDLSFFGEGRDRFRLDGDVRLNGRPMTLDARIGAQGGDGVRALSMSARIPAARASLAASGRLSVSRRSFDGDVTLKSEQGRALLSALGIALSERPALARPFSLAARASVGEAGVVLGDVTLDAGGAAAAGTAEWNPARTPQLTVGLDFAPFALDDWRAVSTVAPAAASPASPAPADQLSVPPVSAEIVLRFPALSYRGQALRDGNLTATLADGELTVSDMSVVLPGTTRLGGFGLIALTAPELSVDGLVSLQTFDTRGFLEWLGADVSGVPPGRLGSASFQAAVQGTLDFLELNDIEGALDTARMRGRLSFAPRVRPFFGVDLRIDNVNIDSYRGVALAGATPAPARPEVYGVAPSGTAYAGLGGFDAEMRLEVGGVTAGGIPGGRVGLDLGLKDGTLNVRAASFENIAGMTGWLSGAIGGFGAALRFDNLQFDLAGDDVSRLAALVGVDLDPALKSLGAASMTGVLDGGAIQADVAATLKTAGLTARAGGQLLDLEKDPRFNGRIEAAHPRFSELMRAAAYAWPAGLRDPGALTVQADISHEADKTVVRDARIAIGRDQFSANAEISRAGDRPVVTAHLTNVNFDLDRVLPAAVSSPQRATSGAGAATASASAWSQEPVTWSFLKGWSGEISLAGVALVARGLSLQDFSARVVVADAAAELADWQGRLFGAPGELSFRLAALPEPAISWQVVLKGADFRAFLAGLNGGRTNLRSSGAVDLTLGFSTRGTSAAAFAAALSGGGALKVTASESGGGLTAGLLGPLNAAAQLDVGSPGKPAPITFQTRLVAANGIVTLEGAEVSSRSHTGKFTGTIDLVRRLVDVTGVLVPRKAGQDQLPIAIRGAMERPNIRLLPPPKG